MKGQKTLKKFEEKLILDEKSKNTREKYLRDAKRFLEYLGANELKKSTVIAYKNELVGKYKVSSANSALAALNCYFKFIGREDCCVKFFKTQKKIYCSEARELTRAEYKRLCKTALTSGKEQLYMILQTICCTGIRIGELSYITYDALENGEATVRCKSKTRVVFLVPQLRKMLLGYCKKHGIISGPVFVTSSGKPIDRTVVWRQMKSLCNDAGVAEGKVYPHNLRHLFARIFYDMNKDIVKLADIMGHSSIDTTRIYIISTGNEHKRCMESMDLVCKI